MDQVHGDLVIAGSGLSGSRVVVRLLTRLLAEAAPAEKPLDIVMIDRFGAFGRGIPYGQQSPAGFLLIEPASYSTPVEFQNWLLANYAELPDKDEDPEGALRDWVDANAERLAGRKLDELFVPRKAFGLYAAEQLYKTVQEAEARGIARVSYLTGEVVDVEPGGSSPFRVFLKDGRTVSGDKLVLATGCIPRKNPYGLSERDGYIHDLYEEAYGGLGQVIPARSEAAGRPIDLLIAGSNASAIEVIYYLAHRPALLDKVRSINVVSSSGYLPGGGIDDERFASWKAEGRRPSAREYNVVADRYVQEGLLFATQAKILDFGRKEDGRLYAGVLGNPDESELQADVIVNCTGAGLLNNTDSPLFTNLQERQHKFKPNALRRGFQLLPGTCEVAGLENCFVIGPLLNQESVETHVESIKAVYRVSEALAEAIYRRIKEPNPVLV